MGIIESVADYVTVKRFFVTVGVFLVLSHIISRLSEHVKIRRLGNYGYMIKPRVPFGLDLVAEAVLATRSHRNLEYWRSKYFPDGTRWTIESRIMNRRIIFTADPENVKAILAVQFSDFGKGELFHEQWKAFLGDSIFTTDGAQWHASRHLIRPQFTKDRVSDLHCFESHIQTLLRTIDNRGPLNAEDQPVVHGAGSGAVVDISDLFFRYTLDVTTEFLLGEDTKSLSSPRNEFAEAFNEVQRVQNIIIRTASIRHLIPKPSFWAGMEVLNRFVNRYIDRTLAMPQEELETRTKDDKGYNFLHALASFTRDPKVLRDQIVAVLLAGRDTTASTLSWCLYELARHPDAVDKLRAEILSTIGRDRTPTYEHLKNMPYLRAVLNETLRLYPSVPYNVRMALQDSTLPRGGGPAGDEPLPVLKGTNVAYSPIVMQRRVDLYPPISDKFAHPEIFSPDRWLHWFPRPHDYIPFNAGPRICIGQQFALTEMSYVLCRLLQRFSRITSHMQDIDGGNPDLKADVVLSPGQGVKVAFWDADD